MIQPTIMLSLLRGILKRVEEIGQKTGEIEVCSPLKGIIAQFEKPGFKLDDMGDVDPEGEILVGMVMGASIILSKSPFAWDPIACEARGYEIACEIEALAMMDSNG